MTGEYHTVFQASYLSNGSLLWNVGFLCLGVVAVVAVVGVCRAWRKKQMHLLQKIMFVCLWAPVWFIGSGLWFSSNITDGKRFTAALANGQCDIVEGTVRVLHQQPWSGHATGDHIQISGQDFAYNYFNTTLAYRQTIAHGGQLTNGVTARLHYLGNQILRWRSNNDAPRTWQIPHLQPPQTLLYCVSISWLVFPSRMLLPR